MSDLITAREFAANLNSDGRHDGAIVSLQGTFVEIALAGPAKLAGTDYQLLVEDGLALCAVLPDQFNPTAGQLYWAQGTLSGVGQFGLFPGIRIAQVSEA